MTTAVDKEVNDQFHILPGLGKSVITWSSFTFLSTWQQISKTKFRSDWLQSQTLFNNWASVLVVSCTLQVIDHCNLNSIWRSPICRLGLGHQVVEIGIMILVSCLVICVEAFFGNVAAGYVENWLPDKNKKNLSILYNQKQTQWKVMKK